MDALPHSCRKLRSNLPSPPDTAASSRRCRPRGFAAPSGSALLTLLLLALSCSAGSRATRITNEDELRAALKVEKSVVELPRGELLIHHELVIPSGINHLEIRSHADGSRLRAADDFEGRAVIVAESVSNLTLAGFAIDGNRKALTRPLGLPPSNVAFADFYPNNGVLLLGGKDLVVRDLSLREISNFAVLVSASTGVRIEELEITASGSLNELKRNNTSGGILIEEGTAQFEVRRCRIEHIGGNAIWTHSNYESPRNADGVIAENEIREVARDAIQVGHATRVRVEGNRGSRIGYPVEWVDVETGGTPVAVDTAGDVDAAVYADNHFVDVNGQCIDLDGFHDGEVRGNSCVNQSPLADYPFAHYGIVFGNTNPDMESKAITVTDNRIEGMAYGGAFVIGSNHRIENNHFLNLNRARCTGDFATAICNWGWDEPGMLRSGIYLGKGHARPADTRGNVIRGNVIQGFGMDRWCIAGAPSVELSENVIGGNECEAVEPLP